MIRLMKLEIQRINLRPYIISSVVFCMVLLGFTYFVAYVAQVEQEAEFMSYINIFRFTGAMSILLFGILSATIHAKLIIEEYSGKRLALLFSYPVSRKKIFAAKVLIVFLFVTLSMLVCTILPICIFTGTESLSPIVSDTMTSDVFLQVLKTLFISLVVVNAIGLLAMRIGFNKKSVPVTLISAFILTGIYGNIAIGGVGNNNYSLPIIGISLFVILAVFVTLSHKINQMEVE